MKPTRETPAKNLLFIATICLLSLCIGEARTFAQQRPRPTAEDARADFAAGQYQPCLQKISQILQDSTTVADADLRYDLLMLRGECLVQLRYIDLARDAFGLAASASRRDT